MADYLISADRALLEKIAEAVDIAEGYHISVRKPGHITERHADIDTHPDGTLYAYLYDAVMEKHLDKARAAVEPNTSKGKWDGVKGGGKVDVDTGPFSIQEIVRAAKDKTWQPVDLP